MTSKEYIEKTEEDFRVAKEDEERRAKERKAKAKGKKGGK